MEGGKNPLARLTRVMLVGVMALAIVASSLAAPTWTSPVGADGHTTTTTPKTTEGEGTTTDSTLTSRDLTNIKSSTTTDGQTFFTVGDGPPTGNEVFISIGGVQGSDHTATLEALKEGYARAGFRVHYIIAAMSFAPFQVKMAEVAKDYTQRKNIRLDHVVFHHAGHGWEGQITYEKPDGQGYSGVPVSLLQENRQRVHPAHRAVRQPHDGKG